MKNVFAASLFALAVASVQPAHADLLSPGAEFLVEAVAGTALIGGGIAYAAIHPDRALRGVSRFAGRPVVTNGISRLFATHSHARRSQTYYAPPATGGWVN